MASSENSGDPEKSWARPTAKEGQAEVWKYFDIELPAKDRVRCTKCPAQYYKYSGSTTVLWNHLQKEHRITRATIRKSQTQSATEPSRHPPQPESSPTDHSGGATSADKSDASPQPRAMKQTSVVDSFARYSRFG